MRKLKFAIVGIILALFNFLIYTFLARVVFNSNDLLWLDSFIAYFLATFLAYFMHSKITWKDRHPTKTGIVGFFFWNFVTALLISPFFTWLFALIKPLYEFLFNLSSTLTLPFDYNFIESTFVFCLTTAVTMVLNYLFYDRLVFSAPPKWLENLTKKLSKIKKNHIFSFLIYSIPILFFIISYFLITTSGEDIWQGAGNFSNGNPLNPFQDMLNAFIFNSRITDMYAWSIIDFYDYQYSFGLDTIFRIIDILVAFATFYFATYLVLDRKPKLQVKDSLIFTGFFSIFILTPFARPFYEEFSMIHNYPPLILATLIFIIPYLKLILNKSPKNHLTLLAIAMLFLGLYFGMATTVTPIAFLVTLALYCLIRRKHLKNLPLWFFSGLIGILIGLFLTQILFSATDHYINNSASLSFDYISLSALFSNPLPSIFSLLKHFCYNFGLVLLPLIAIYIFFALLTKNFRFYFSKKFFTSLSTETRRFYLAGLFFVFIHLFGYIQIIAPFRLLMPPFFIGLILIFRIFHSEFNSKILTYSTIIISTIILLVHSIFLINYHITTSKILAEIKNSDSTDICLEPSRVAPPRIKIINLNQANILVDWGTPEIIYDKNITFCK